MRADGAALTQINDLTLGTRLKSETGTHGFSLQREFPVTLIDWRRNSIPMLQRCFAAGSTFFVCLAVVGLLIAPSSYAQLKTDLVRPEKEWEIPPHVHVPYHSNRPASQPPIDPLSRARFLCEFGNKSDCCALGKLPMWECCESGMLPQSKCSAWRELREIFRPPEKPKELHLEPPRDRRSLRTPPLEKPKQLDIKPSRDESEP